MANRLFRETQNNSLMSRLQMLKENPQKFLLQSEFKIPPEYQNSPEDAVNYLVQSGQVSQDQINYVMSMASKMGIKL